MDLNNLLLETVDRVTVITINRPEKLNSLNHETLTEIESVFRNMDTDSCPAAVVITGAGDKSFVSGADIAELSRQDALSGQRFALFGQGIFDAIDKAPVPVIAAVNGYALGGGCELALACHVRIASENAKFGQPEVNLGIIPGYGGTQRLARAVGPGRAAELILTGNVIDAAEALRIGLVNRVVPRGEALAAALEMAAVIASRSPVAVRNALQALRAAQESSLSEGLRIEAAVFGLTCGSQDFREGTAAFLEKRQARFTGK